MACDCSHYKELVVLLLLLNYTDLCSMYSDCHDYKIPEVRKITILDTAVWAFKKNIITYRE